MRSLFIGVFSALALAVACRSGSSGPPTRPDTARKDPYLIKAAELDASGRDNLYDAVRQLRPTWFTRRTRQRSGEETIIVYLDERQFGTARALREVSPRSVESVRYLSPTEAQVRFGQINSGRPAILIESARQP